VYSEGADQKLLAPALAGLKHVAAAASRSRKK
jgi:hypothetical protein